MGQENPCILLRIYPDGRVERSELASGWKQREELILYSIFLQPALSALDVSAQLWKDLTGKGKEAAQ